MQALALLVQGFAPTSMDASELTGSLAPAMLAPQMRLFVKATLLESWTVQGLEDKGTTALYKLEMVKQSLEDSIILCGQRHV